MCINVDGQLASELIIGAVGQENWEVEIKGRASHAGVAPEKGISATMVGAVALAEAHRGRLVRQGRQAGRPRHQQCRHLWRQGRASRPATRRTSSPTTPSSRARRAVPKPPSRPRSPTATRSIRQGASRRHGPRGRHGGSDFQPQGAYPPFELDKDAPVVKRAAKALEMLGIEPTYLFSNGGLDANWLDKHGIPTVTIGSGQAEIHTIKEYVRLAEFEKGAVWAC